MKATGIVRRIDDLGRVVIPKEIRRTLRIREGDQSLTTLTSWQQVTDNIDKLAAIQLCPVGFSQKNGLGLVHIDEKVICLYIHKWCFKI